MSKIATIFQMTIIHVGSCQVLWCWSNGVSAWCANYKCGQL